MSIPAIANAIIIRPIIPPVIRTPIIVHSPVYVHPYYPAYHPPIFIAPTWGNLSGGYAPGWEVASAIVLILLIIAALSVAGWKALR